jgi:hypothetical protein
MQHVQRAQVPDYAINALHATKSSPSLSSRQIDQIPNTVGAFCCSKGICGCHVLNNLLFDNMALRMHLSLSSLLVSTKEESVSL